MCKLEMQYAARYTDPGSAMKKGKMWMLDPDAAFKPPGTVKTGQGTKEFGGQQRELTGS